MNFVMLNDVRINYLQIQPHSGRDVEGAEIVLLHGLATNIGFWYLGVGKALSHFGRVTVFDLRGHGRSTMPQTGYSADTMAEDLSQLLDRLDIDAAHLIGHSYGGLVAASFAAAHPSKIKSLTLADVRFPSIQPKLTPQTWPLARLLIQTLKKHGIEICENEPEFGVELFTQIAKLKLSGAAAPPILDKVLGGAGRGMGRRTAEKWLKLIETTTARRDFAFGSAVKPDDLRGIGRPIYGLYGENSMTIRTGQALAESVPGLRFETISKAGHFFPSSRPKEFAMRSMAFLADEIRISPGVLAAGAAMFDAPPTLH